MGCQANVEPGTDPADQPNLVKHGWRSQDTVVQIVTDDMPYLVDSVVAEPARGHVSVRRLVHPLVVVRRDFTGSPREVLTHSGRNDTPNDALVESWMYVNIDRITDADQARQVERGLPPLTRDALLMSSFPHDHGRAMGPRKHLATVSC